MGFSPERKYAICQGYDSRGMGNKNRFPFLQKEIRPTIYTHISENTKFEWADEYYAVSVSKS